MKTIHERHPLSDLNQRTKEHYNALMKDIGGSYLEHRWRSHPLQLIHYEQTRRTLQRVLNEEIVHSSHMLEVGCGPGTWTDLCLNHTRNLTLLDISEEMLSKARQRVGDRDRVWFHCGDFTKRPFRDGTSFDAIVSVRAIEYMADKLALVSQARELLTPAGVLVLVTKNPSWRDATEKGGFEREESGGIHSGWIDWMQLSDLLELNGFEVRTIRAATTGSYRYTLNNRFGRSLARGAFELVHKRRMSRIWDAITESYVLVACRD